MDLDSLKRWHWIVIGLLLGLAMALWQMFLHNSFGPRFDTRVDRSIDQSTFERSLVAPGGRWEFIYGPITVHPQQSDGKQWVTGYLSRSNYRNADPDAPREAFLFMSGLPYPYTPMMLPKDYTPSDSYSVTDYVKAMAAEFPASQIESKYAWWEETLASSLISIALMTFVVGGLFPTAIAAMTGGGFGPSAEQRATREARRAAKAAAKAKAAGVPSAPASDEPRLLAEARAREAAAAKNPTMAVPDPVPAFHQDPGKPKTYKGEFYPVEKPNEPHKLN